MNEQAFPANGFSIDLTEAEQRGLLEVECCLRLRERLTPELPCDEVWVLISGLLVVGTPNDPGATRLRAAARRRAGRLASAAAWQAALAWYAGQPPAVRLYEPDLSAGDCRRRADLAAATSRLAAYDAALDEICEPSALTQQRAPERIAGAAPRRPPSSREQTDGRRAVAISFAARARGREEFFH